MNPDKLRYRNDKKLYDELLEERDVVSINDRLQEMEAEGPAGTRRQLLSTSVRLSASMAPDIQKMADECVERLSMEIPVELFVYSSPTFNAACFKPEAGRLYVMFSSSLLEGFSASELRFVMGHEFGHYIYGHHDIPIGYLLKGRKPPGPKLALNLFAWSRYAEISADRAGAWCAQDMDGVASALFKLASGLTGNVVRFNLNDFLAQVDDMQAVNAEPGQGAPEADWFSTHPFSPLRVRALQLFHDSELMKESGTSIDEMDIGVHQVMSLMEPNYLDARTDAATAMRHLLFSGAIAVAAASDGVSEREIEVFEQFFDKGDFSDKLNISRIKQELPSRIERVCQKTTQTQRIQVLRDICLIAKAEGKTTPAERAVLDNIADGLNVSRNMVCDTLDRDYEPD
ncbi:MAG: M48 family metallopeptidase [Granulosicoccus sp.]